MVLTALSCGKKNNGDSGPTRIVTPVVTDQYFEMLNRHRIKLGLNPLIYSKTIEDTARNHSLRMANGQIRFGHSGMWTRCSRLRERMNSSYCGEIVAKGQDTAARLLNSWLKSPDHQLELEDPYWTHTAIAFAQDRDGVFYWTQIFLKI
jgi:uncharacterized protein YkwD